MTVEEEYPDFWGWLMNEPDVEETHVTARGGWSVPTDQYYDLRGFSDEVFEEATGVSRFDNGNVIVGEIVEDERALPAGT